MRLAALLVSFLITIAGFGSTRAECPHLISGLEAWSNPSTWPSDLVPSAGANVVIPNGKKVLLDVSPPGLGSILIEAGGQLVWSPAGDYEVRAGHILIEGRLDIGSEDCKFESKATITLTGKIGEGQFVDGYGRKFMGVAEGGTIELHGKDPSPSWTKLTNTVHSSVSNGATNITTAMDRGLNVVLFDQNGARLAKRVFDFILGSTVETEFIEFMNSQASGTIMAAAVYDATNFNAAMSSQYFTTMQAWGATGISDRDYRDSYAVIGVKGGTADERWSAAGEGPSEFVTRNFTTTDGVFNVGVQSAGANDGLFIKIESQIFVNNVIIDLVDDVTWQAGDKIVLASTDFSPYQSEEATLVACPECTSKQVKLSAQPKYMHWGEITDCVDERGEVGLLTRNILIRGEVESECYGMPECAYIPGNIDLFGGHFKVMMGFANAHIEGVEFYKMGQQLLGSYPVHFHLCGDVDEVGGYSQPTYVKKCSIHRSLSRCITMHQTNGLLVQDNVAYDHLGHCIFLEDGIEMRNVIDRNLAILTRFGTVLPTDRNCDTCTAMADPQYPNPSCSECLALSTYWMTNPDNILTNNVAAGSEFVGIWYIFPERPTGDSEALGIQLGINPSLTALAKFENNTSHSNKENGLFFEDGVNADNPTAGDKTQKLAKFPDIRYNPRVDYKNRNSARAPAIVRGYLGYKNGNRGAWARGGDIWFENGVFADNAIGLTLASDGEMPNDYGSHQAISGGLFVGKTANYGQKMDDETWDPELERTMPNIYTNWPLRGFEFYDGPLRLEHLGFKGFLVDDRNNASAFGNFLLNNWQAATSSYVTDLKFYDDSRRLYHGLEGQPWFDVNSLDGDKNPLILDLDGSLTGVANSNVVRNNPFFTSYNCYARPQWEAQVCKEKFGQLYITNEDPDSTNFNGLTMTAQSSTASSILFAMTRDEYPDYDLELMGTPPYSAPPRIRFQPLVMLSKSYTIKFKHPTPPALSFQLTNWDQNDWARIGVCFPPSTFTVTKSVGSQVTTLTEVSTIQEVDNSDGSMYYYDTMNGLIFFKAVAKHERNQYDFCSTEGCETYKIVATGDKHGADFPCNPYPTYEKTPVGCDGSSGRIDKCGACNGNGGGCSDSVHELQCSDYTNRSPVSNNPSDNTPTGQVSSATILTSMVSFAAIGIAAL